jgi:hypothetical protein
VTHHVLIPLAPKLDLAPRKGIEAGDHHPKCPLQCRMPTRRVLTVFLQEMTEPNVQERTQRLNPEVRQAKRPVLIMPARAKLPAFRQAEHEKHAF